MEYRILGPLELLAGGERVPLGPDKQRALLAILLLNSGRTVSRDRLIDDLWGEEAPPTAAKAIQNFVSRLRKLLPPETLVTRSPGYVIELSSGELDLERFERLLADGRSALSSDEPETSSAMLHEALSLWRGPALAEFESEPFARIEEARLEELRLVTLEERIEADLRLGRHADIVGELESLVARHRLRERLRAQLMLALYRSGRQAEALSAYQDARRALADELGLEPSRKLQDLQQAILRHEPTLELRTGVARHTPTRSAMPDRSVGGRPTVGRTAESETFVGRELELGRLEASVHDALEGRGGLVLLTGEPGIGKTRTAIQLMSYAESLGALTVSGRCSEREGAPPYWPWVQALRAYLAAESDEGLAQALGPDGATIAEIVPELRLKVPGLEPSPPPPDSEQARFRLLDSTASFVRRAARSRPLVIVLDDLHAADPGTLMLLEFVAHGLTELPLLVVCTYRDAGLARGDPLLQTLAEVARDQLPERIALRGLAAEDVSRFIELNTGLAAPAGLVAAVHAQTEGNPLFVVEVVRLLRQEGRLSAETVEQETDWTVGVPAGVREVISRRLDGLSQACNETLRLASVIGREFGIDQLGSLVESLSEEELVDVLDEALAAQLIEERAVAGRYQFTHGLIQESLTAELSASRRIRLHARIAEALESLYGDDAPTHAAELAHHFTEAEPVLGPSKLVDYSLLAGESALAAYAYEQALALFERALAAKGDGDLDDETAALLFGLGRAQVAAMTRYELKVGVTTLRRAFDYYVEAGDVARAVAVAAHPLPLSIGLGPTGYAELNERGLALVSEGSAEAGRLLAMRGWVCGLIDADHAAAEDAFRQALSIARSLNDPTLEGRTLANAAFVDAFHLRYEDCLAHATRSIDLARVAGDLPAEVQARRAAAWALTSTGEPDQAHLHLDVALAQAERLREQWWLVSASYDQELLALYQGDWDRAREMSEFGLAIQPKDCRQLALRAILEFGLGNTDEGMEYLTRLQELAASVPPPGPIADHAFLAIAIPLISRGADTDVGLDTARASGEGVLAVPRQVPVLAMIARRGMALIAAQQGDSESAEALYQEVVTGRGSASMFVPLSVDRVLGLLALAAGRIDAALAHFEEGLAFCERAGYRPEHAWTASDHAEALLARGHPNDRDRAIALQDAALRTAQELGMRPLVERVLAGRASARVPGSS